MEYIVLLPVLILMWLVLTDNKAKSKTNLTNPIKIDDKNWIHNGELVSFEEDTPLLRFQQEMEDNKHYRNYERQRMLQDRDMIFNDLMKTKDAIHRFPDLEDCITKEKMIAITEKYDQYLKMCRVLEQEPLILTKEEFLVKEENVMLCVSFIGMQIFKQIGCYTIHNEKTAKYKGRSVSEAIAEEFKQKRY